MDLCNFTKWEIEYIRLPPETSTFVKKFEFKFERIESVQGWIGNFYFETDSSNTLKRITPAGNALQLSPASLIRSGLRIAPEIFT